MARREPAIPPIKCTARSRRTKATCRKWAIPGTVVCKLHGGGAPQVREKAAVRSTLAELIQRDPRHPWQVVLDATHIGDSLMKECEEPLRRGQSLTAEQVDRLVESTRLAHHLAKTALDTRAHEMLAERTERDTKLEGEIVGEVVGRSLDALARSASLPVQYVEPIRRWLLDVAQHALSTLDGDGSLDDLAFPSPPVELTYVCVVKPVTSSTAQTSATSDYASDVERQRTGATGPSASRSSARTGVPAATVAGESDEPLDAELVDEPEASPKVQRRTTRQRSNLPNPWRYGGHPATRAIG